MGTAPHHWKSSTYIWWRHHYPGIRRSIHHWLIEQERVQTESHVILLLPHTIGVLGQQQSDMVYTTTLILLNIPPTNPTHNDSNK